MIALLLSLGLVGAEPQTGASWIWFPEEAAVEGAGQTRYFRLRFDLAQKPRQASLRARWDDGASFWVNGATVAPRSSDLEGTVWDLTSHLRPGENVLAFAVTNSVGAGGLIVRGAVTKADGSVDEIVSDARWRVSRTAPDGWNKPGFHDATWPAARIVGSAYAPPWYRHPAFPMTPFITPAEQEAHARWREEILTLPPGLAAEGKPPIRLGQVGRHAVLRIGERSVPPLFYRGTVDPLTDHGRRQIERFRGAGVHLYTAYYPLAGCCPGPGKYDFGQLDEIVRAYLSADPEASLIFILRLVPPSWWIDSHPDDMVRYAAGDDYNSSDDTLRVRMPSLASSAWHAMAMDLWRRAIEHLEAQPWGKRVIGYHPGYGIYTEWHYFGSWSNQMPDTGPAMTRHFREWLGRRYGADDKLREARRDPRATLAGAEVPGVAPRLAAGPLGLRSPAQGSWVSDYYRCQQELTARCMEGFCREAKRVTGDRVIAGAFYGYFEGVPPQTQGGHLELPSLLKSPAIDYFAAPYDYSHRLMGDDGRTRAVVDAFALAGKVHMIEDDTRTYLHPVDEHGRAPTAAATVAAMRRMMGAALIHRTALWWCDFGRDDNGGWYDEPALLAEVANLQQLAARRLKQDVRSAAQVLLVADPQGCYSLGDGAAMRIHYALVDQVTGALHRTGAPFDFVLLPQLEDLDLRPYRVIVWLGCLRVDSALREKVRAASQGRSVVWLWAPGIRDGVRFGPELVRDLTGFSVALEGAGVSASEAIVGDDDPLTAGLPSVPADTIEVARSEPLAHWTDVAAWYNPRSPAQMERYRTHEVRAADGGIDWRVATYDSWSDVHLRAPVAACDGLGLKVSGEGAVAGATLCVVVKDRDDAEYVSAPLPLQAAATGHRLALTGLAKASWYRGNSTGLKLPLTGFKFVVHGLGGGREGVLRLRDLAALHGRVVRQNRRVWPGPGESQPCLTIPPQAGVTILARRPGGGEGLVAVSGRPAQRHLFTALASLPLPVLRTLCDEAGVHRYVARPDVLVQADTGLLVLHTATGGPCTVSLPRPERLLDAITGEAVGTGRQIELRLPAPATWLLERQVVE